MDLDKTPYKSGLTEFLSKYAVYTQLVIPVYQRNYTWTVNDQLMPLLDDIEKVLYKEFDKHFMGIIIYNVTKCSAISGNEFSIIDGQQRITTTVILLYAIRDLLIDDKKQLTATRIENTYLSNTQLGEDMKLKLKPLVSDDFALKKIVNREFSKFDEKDINSNVYKNYCKIKEWLNDLINEFSVEDILNAINQLYIVAVPVDNTDYPQRIFESINSKGVPLNSSDLIRNYIFMGLDNNTQEQYYLKYWKEIEINTGGDSKKLEEFLRFYIAAQSFSLPSKNNNGIYHAFKKLLEDKYGNKLNEINNIKEIIEMILNFSRYYNIIYISPIQQINPSYSESLKEYRNIDSNMPAPFLLKIFDLNSDTNEYHVQKISNADVASLISVTTNYLMRRALSNLDTSDVTKLFAPLTREVISECNTIGFENVVEVYKKYLINKNQGKGSECPDDIKLRDYIKSNSNMYILKATRVLLDRIELYDNPAPVDLSKLSVEHLMPQTHTAAWLTYLNCTEDKYCNYLNKLGNLTLATKHDNSAMQNNPYKYKRELLSDTNHLNLNKEILKHEDWKFNEIDDRTDQLIVLINKIYPYQSASNTVLNKKTICISNDKAQVEAIFDEDTHSVEILPGSIMKKSDNSYQIESQNQRLLELLEEGIIAEEDGNYAFKKDYTFYPQGNSTALSTSAGFILHGSKNGWDYWTMSDGTKLNVYYKHSFNEYENSLQDVIDSYWELVNKEIVNDHNLFHTREDYHKKTFNFNIRKKYHGFIDLNDISENLIKYGLCFNNQDKGYHDLKNALSTADTNYCFDESETTGIIFLKEELPELSEEDKKEQLAAKMYNAIKGLIDSAKEVTGR